MRGNYGSSPSLGVRARYASVVLLAMLAMVMPGIGNGHGDAQKVQVLDPHALPLGDGKISREPRRGYVFACGTQFHGGGAHRVGDWIQGATWDLTRKIWVQGEVAWPDARFSASDAGSERLLSGNGLPVGGTTGIFPIRRDDPAYRFDRNPNVIATQQVMLSLPLAPVFAASPSCVPMGMIGVALNGVAIFNALDDAGRDAVAHEVQDRCQGHPERQGRYHYHGPSDCLAGAASNNTLVGYALDGFGIYSGYDAQGKEITNDDLDECHGRVGRVLWNGRQVEMYHYVLTREYPYTVGCFRGTPVRAGGEGRVPGGVARSSDRDLPRRPPDEAIASCVGVGQAAPCRFTSPRGDMIRGSCRTVGGGAFACVPVRR